MARIIRKEKYKEPEPEFGYRLKDTTTGLYWRGYSGWSAYDKWTKTGKVYVRLSDLMNSVNQSSQVHFDPNHSYSLLTYELVPDDWEDVVIR